LNLIDFLGIMSRGEGCRIFAIILLCAKISAEVIYHGEEKEGYESKGEEEGQEA
jgi:hypothetical protein